MFVKLVLTNSKQIRNRFQILNLYKTATIIYLMDFTFYAKFEFKSKSFE